MWAPQENGLCGFITPMSVGVMVDMIFRWNVVKTHQLWTGVIVILLGNPPLKSSGMSFHFLWNKTCNSILVWVKMSCFSLKFFGWWRFQNPFNSPYHSKWTGDFPSTRPLFPIWVAQLPTACPVAWTLDVFSCLRRYGDPVDASTPSVPSAHIL